MLERCRLPAAFRCMSVDVLAVLGQPSHQQSKKRTPESESSLAAGSGKSKLSWPTLVRPSHGNYSLNHFTLFRSWFGATRAILRILGKSPHHHTLSHATCELLLPRKNRPGLTTVIMPYHVHDARATQHHRATATTRICSCPCRDRNSRDGHAAPFLRPRIAEQQR